LQSRASLEYRACLNQAEKDTRVLPASLEGEVRMFSKGKTKDVSTPRICDVVWHDGEFIKWDDARVHVMSHVLHYGSSVFEGIRCYATKKGPAIFRLREHMQRFLNSAKVYRMDHDWTIDDFCDASVELVRRSGLDQCYIRPILFRSLDEAN